VVGFALSMIGVDPYGNERTFGFDALLGGIPWYPVVLGIMIVPKLLFDKTQLMLSSTAVKFYFNFATVIRSTLLGYIGGLVPGISYIIGPKLAWIVENKISQNPLKRLLAAETANNASYYSMIVPLLLLSVPIVSSEAIILELANNKGFQFNWNTIITSGWFASTVAPIISINLLLGLMSFFCVKWLIFWKNLPKINLVVSALLFVSLIFNANNIHYELLVFVISFIIGIMLRNFDVLPLILTFIIGDQIEQNLIRFLTINNFI
jgi:TctA family transporter